MTELFERLKVCWCVLTKRNYAFFACKTSAVEFDKGGRYTGTNGKKLAAYSSLVDGKYFRTNDGARSFGFFFWGAVCSFSNKMTEQELKGGQDE